MLTSASSRMGGMRCRGRGGAAVGGLRFVLAVLLRGVMGGEAVGDLQAAFLMQRCPGIDLILLPVHDLESAMRLARAQVRREMMSMSCECSLAA